MCEVPAAWAMSRWLGRGERPAGLSQHGRGCGRPTGGGVSSERCERRAAGRISTDQPWRSCFSLALGRALALCFLWESLNPRLQLGRSAHPSAFWLTSALWQSHLSSQRCPWAFPSADASQILQPPDSAVHRTLPWAPSPQLDLLGLSTQTVICTLLHLTPMSTD